MDVRKEKFAIVATVIKKVQKRFVSEMITSKKKFDFLEPSSPKRFELPFSTTPTKSMPSWAVDLIRKFFTNTARAKESAAKVLEITSTTAPIKMFTAQPKRLKTATTTSTTKFVPAGFVVPKEVTFFDPITTPPPPTTKLEYAPLIPVEKPQHDDVLPSPPVPIIVNLIYEQIRQKLTLLIPISENVNEDGSEVDDSCRDRMKCDVMKIFCGNPNYQNVKFYCQKTCNACDESITLTTTQNPLCASFETF
jgi:hypothetical protein